ncbi:hypothetical protein IP92_02482 [Pseudoduganella flava]|uniref:Uncharacterized protein n=1 Tax=Pseudoduganella flava TaxID=871742 RepID=A0A562PSK6_9BURK|nr:hypothetical protein [Pseudoduganella flava]QGZ39278.1 hypothetical protein GO485_09605 [Pseudoduganella flava]TWI47422.1 hypothetical protein IP92_02482 [Pseudoduganella flava]
MTDIRHAVAEQAAAGLATALLIERCRSGAEQGMLPQGRWLTAVADGLLNWLHDGGFTGAENVEAAMQTAAQGRRSRETGNMARNGNSLGTATRQAGSSARNHRAIGC